MFSPEVPRPTPPSAACGALLPTPVPMQQHSSRLEYGSCRSSAGDGSGTLAFLHSTSCVEGDCSGHLDIVPPVGTATGDKVSDATLLQQPRGFLLVERPFGHGPTPQAFWTSAFDPAGAPLGQSQAIGASGMFAAPDPRGGLVVAGRLDAGDVLNPLGPSSVAGFSSGPQGAKLKWGPVPLASAGAVYGLGIDVNGRALVVSNGTSRFGPGSVSAQWFGEGGAALTGEFLLASSFVPGTATWFELAPLIGGGLAIERRDVLVPGTTAAAVWILSIGSGATTAEPPPQWLTERPGTHLAIARAGQGYALLSIGLSNTPCTQSVEVMTPDGQSCGHVLYSARYAGVCATTQDLVLTPAGTIVQKMPDDMDPASPSGMTRCTWRYWPAALR